MSPNTSLSITYGIHAFDFHVSGLSVAEVHSAVKDLTGAPDDAEPYLDGQRVLDPSVSTAGATRLVFVKAAGRKGCGLWEEDRFLAFTGITRKRLDELCELGLKLIEADGKRWLYDEEAAKWTRFLIEQTNKPTFHLANFSPPAEFAFGPLVGSKGELATWISGRPTKKADALVFAARRGTIWVREVNYRRCEVWFRHEARYRTALRAQAEVPTISRRRLLGQ